MESMAAYTALMKVDMSLTDTCTFPKKITSLAHHEA
jgi:hypothetical protein